MCYDPHRKRGVANLLEILAACEGSQPADAAQRFTSYAELKDVLAQTVVELLQPVQARHAELAADPGQLSAVRRQGARRARDVAAQTVRRAKRAIGLTPL